MNVKLFLIGTIFFINFVFPQTSDEPLGEYRKAKKEIYILNLVKGLELEKEQAEFIVEKIKEVENIRENFLNEFIKIWDRNKYAFEEFKNYLLKEDIKKIPHPVKRNVTKANHKLKELQFRYNEEIKRIAKEVRNNLKDFQIYALQEFVPCIIPPEKGLRVGQAEGGEAFEKVLERIRKIPDRIYEEKKDEIAERIVERNKKHVPKRYEFDERKEKERILSIIEEARELSDVDFEVKKSELAEKLKTPLNFPRISDETKIILKIEQFLLTPKAKEIIEKIYLSD